jgi:hypothetical protein
MSELLGKVSDDHGKERKRKCCGKKKKGGICCNQYYNFLTVVGCTIK